ncbi:heterokaryon incompatibility protein-domain-containing protein [Hypomontagnella submonticulosa]|nr:heterokaryon incompatibility protein-domain-containing protein [Hypomontagnella submonticulosa]
MSQHRPNYDQKTPRLYQELVGSDIRLLRIHAGDVDAEIQCDLLHLQLDARPDYFALSYVWGDVSKKISILVNGQQFDVGENLYDALRHLRQFYVQPDSSPFIWIDAMCINQEDIDERSRQVTRMTDIYTLSYQVIIWLGTISERDDELIGGLFGRATTSRSEREAQSADEISCNNESDLGDEDEETYYLPPPDSRALRAMSLQSLPWFQRVWTVQEACLGARDPIMWAGRHRVAMQDLFDLLSGWVALYPNVATYCYRILALVRIRQLLCRADPLDGGSRIGLRDGSTGIARLFVELIIITGESKATDPLDHLYGLIGLVRVAQDEELPEALRPDYTLKTEQAYEKYATYFLNQTGDLRLLGFCKSELEGVPSWVADFRHMKRFSSHPPCMASISIGGRVLSIQGFTIGKCGNQIPYCSIDRCKLFLRDTYSCLARFRLFEKEIIYRSASITQTSTEDTLDCWLSSTKSSRSVYEDLINRLESDGSASMKHMVDKVALINKLCHGWLVLTNGTIVAGRKEDARIQEHDLVCLFKGSSSASVVREVPHGYQFMGPCRIINGPYCEVEFDEIFWAGRDQVTFELI